MWMLVFTISIKTQWDEGLKSQGWHIVYFFLDVLNVYMYVWLIACIHDNYCCLTLCDYWTNDVHNNENMYGYIYLHTCYMQFWKTHNLVSMVGSLQLSCRIWQLDFNCSVIWNVIDLLGFHYLYCTHLFDILDSL